MFIDLIFTNILAEVSLAYLLFYTLISSAVYIVTVVLAPLWVGILTGIQQRTKLWVIPLVPYLVTTAIGLIYSFASNSSESLDVFSQNFALQIIFVLYVVGSIAAFVTWLVAWVICSLDRNYYDAPARAEAVGE